MRSFVRSLAVFALLVMALLFTPSILEGQTPAQQDTVVLTPEGKDITPPIFEIQNEQLHAVTVFARLAGDQRLRLVTLEVGEQRKVRVPRQLYQQNLDFEFEVRTRGDVVKTTTIAYPHTIRPGQTIRLKIGPVEGMSSILVL